MMLGSPCLWGQGLSLTPASSRLDGYKWVEIQLCPQLYSRGPAGYGHAWHFMWGLMLQTWIVGLMQLAFYWRSHLFSPWFGTSKGETSRQQRAAFQRWALLLSWRCLFGLLANMGFLRPLPSLELGVRRQVLRLLSPHPVVVRTRDCFIFLQFKI